MCLSERELSRLTIIMLHSFCTTLLANLINFSHRNYSYMYKYAFTSRVGNIVYPDQMAKPADQDLLCFKPGDIRYQHENG